jgi:hypothetical protein
LPEWAFVVQFRTETELEQGRWVGRVEHVVSGQTTRFHTLEELRAFVARVLTTRYRKLASKAVERLADDWERLVTFYRFPREHWPHLRTSDVVESPFATVRLRTTAAKRFKKVENATALIWKILPVAESTFRRLKGAELLPAVYAGAQYVDGVR